MSSVIVSSSLNIDEDEHNEFRMHWKMLISEVAKFQTSQDKDGSIRRTIQPISKTICAFLNTDGGRVFIGIDEFQKIKGVNMSRNMLDHFFGSLRQMCDHFKPFNPLNRIKVTVMTVHKITEDKIKLKRVNLEKYTEEEKMILMPYHEIGSTFCECFKEPFTHEYLIVINVSAPRPDENTVIFQNEEGLAYRRRLASNKCVYFDDIRRILKERDVVRDLHDEVRKEIDRFINIRSLV
ncbi:unnamed protein product [Caenorhabditis bovis]|uniref:Schlafen AlbA-2 domain-containing protein n=1 Tax=Caenorhabditis bovis TaxID=2654633 RepID=A0A8S1E9D7_9PELO|nr:unnamed protein product [Caenorhabditis bovis]